MTHWLFPHFLTDRDAYLAARRFWEALWEKVGSGLTSANRWDPWMDTPTPDGNPIFTALSRSLGRGVRIIQEEPAEGQVDLDWWLDSFGDQDDPEAVRELVVACCPSRENVVHVERLLKEWVETGAVTAGNPPGPVIG